MQKAIIKWEGPEHPEFLDIVQREICDLMENGLGRAADLIFHSIWLDDGDPHGRTIMLFGKDGDEAIYAQFIEKPVIVDANGQPVAPDA